MAQKNKFYITTPIFYPNAKLHMGHAYTTTVSDIVARYHRLIGDKVHFLAGSDENTQKMVDSARVAGKEPLEFLEDIVSNFASLYKKLGISYDQFIRTTDQQKHWPGAQALGKKIDAAGDLYKKKYEELYCVGHEAFITKKDLVDGKCPEHDTVPEIIREENYFFRLSRYTDMLQEKIESDELHIIPQSRKNEVLSFISQGLEDVSFSRLRRPEWPQELGVPVPDDPSQVMYVWCDALANYITALGFGTDETRYKEFWPADVHVMGKDIVRFHAVYWPAFLLSAGVDVPRRIFSHGFLFNRGEKMSKSVGNVIDPFALADAYGVDQLRYFFLREVPFGQDGNYRHEAIVNRINADLAAVALHQVRRVEDLGLVQAQPVESSGTSS